MKFQYTDHWFEKRKIRRQDIKDYLIEYCILNSPRIKDRKWEGAYNAICRIPPSNVLLKVVYIIEGKGIKIITAYWIYEK